jgi:hypothetical protein
MRALILAASLLVGFGGAAWAQVEKNLTGTWSGTFELVSLSDKAGFGPAKVFEGKMRVISKVTLVQNSISWTADRR